MEVWLADRLSCCLQLSVPMEMVKYILSFKSVEEFDDYFQSLLDPNLIEHREFIKELKQKFFEEKLNKKKSQKTNLMARKAAQKNLPPQAVIPKSTENPTKIQPISTENPVKNQQFSKHKKQKFVNLYSKDGGVDVVLLKGRKRCECQASKHKLVNNCSNCGRIICIQEGPGPCLFCATLVISADGTPHKSQHTSEKGKSWKNTTQKSSSSMDELNKALQHRDHLLEYDKLSEKRTSVIDDESDYFHARSIWLSEKEREKVEKLEQQMENQKHASRLNRKIVMDITGREIIEEYSEIANDVLSSIEQSKPSDLPTDLISQQATYIPINLFQRFHDDSKQRENDSFISRIQDKELLEVQDMRNCLSMHQPWASLLIAGIKKHEGRTWYTRHRGRLWIASTRKPVDIEDVKRMEEFYKVLQNGDSIKFPTQYPSGCLLGCVSIQDCLPQEEYQKVYSPGESDSPFVLICSDSHELSVRFPVKGSHKIYKLDSNIYAAALKCLK